MTAEDVLGDLARLQRDSDPCARAIGAALSAAVLEALEDAEDTWVARIEGLRAEMEGSDEQIDTALPNSRGEAKFLGLAETCRRRSKKRPWGTFLLTLARTLGPEQTLELGTCLAISSSYIAAGLSLNGHGRLITLEGAGALAERSRRNLAQLGLDNVDVRSGLFADTLSGVLAECAPPSLVFIDGHHQEGPTLAYFRQIAEHLTDPAVVVFDDIRWSDGMERAWASILEEPSVRVALDLEHVGVCVVGAPATGQPARVHRLPSITTMQSRLKSVVSPDVPSAHFPVPQGPVARLNWGCGEAGERGWINADVKRGPRVDIVADIRDGLPLDDHCMDYVASVHALQEIPLPDVVGALLELRRVLKPGGTLRLVLPDLEQGVAAWQRGDKDHFIVGDTDAATLSGKLITQLLWYGYSATLFTAEFVEELLTKAGFSTVHHCNYRQTASRFPEIVDLDNRDRESIFIEAVG